MKNIDNSRMDALVARYPSLGAVSDDIVRAFSVLGEAFASGGKLLVAGNGGSAADGEHIVGELMKGFCRKRKLALQHRNELLGVDPELGKNLAEHLQGALPAISLISHPALSTAFMNDCDPTMTFAQQVNGLGRKGDVLLAISTSGNSLNVLYAAVAAKAAGMKVVGLTGQGGGRLAALCEVCIKVPEIECYKVQEMHLPVYHTICLMLEDRFFPDGE